MLKQEIKKLAIVAVFAVAMGYLEAAVVVYLRLLYYAGGFGFPMKKFMEPEVLLVEASRELATLVMLLGLAWLAGAGLKNRFAYFLFSFAVWDLTYYAGLKIVLNWPDSLMTNDLLFLIPWAWVSPVLAPVIASVTMILLAVCLLNTGKNLDRVEWSLLVAGGLMMLYTFLIDYGRLLAKGGYFGYCLTLSSCPGLQKALADYVPGPYNWVLFLAGEAVILAGITRFFRRTRG
jgi:hypothetical protein